MTSTIDTITSNSTAVTSLSGTSGSDQVMDKEDFLTLLVAQMENQDPLNPTDATEYTAQLAQYSSLEQLMNLNDNVESMLTTLSTNQSFSLDTLGQDVAYYGDTFDYDGGTVELGYNLETSAEDVTLLIQLNGKTTAELSCSEYEAGSHYLTWDGLTDEGTEASSGEYSIVVDAADSSGSEINCSSIICSEVTGVNLGDGGSNTLVTRQGEVLSSDILAVFD